jgi:hypothetical protein
MRYGEKDADEAFATLLESMKVTPDDGYKLAKRENLYRVEQKVGAGYREVMGSKWRTARELCEAIDFACWTLAHMRYLETAYHADKLPDSHVWVLYEGTRVVGVYHEVVFSSIYVAEEVRAVRFHNWLHRWRTQFGHPPVSFWSEDYINFLVGDYRTRGLVK